MLGRHDMKQFKEFWADACEAADSQPIVQLQLYAYGANGTAVRNAHISHILPVRRVADLIIRLYCTHLLAGSLERCGRCIGACCCGGDVAGKWTATGMIDRSEYYWNLVIISHRTWKHIGSFR
jgi:hypothetical protein